MGDPEMRCFTLGQAQDWSSHHVSVRGCSKGYLKVPIG